VKWVQCDKTQSREL